MDQSSDHSVRPFSREDFDALVKAAALGDEEALQHIRSALDRRPDFWRAASDLAGQTEAAWVAAVASRNGVVSEAIRRRLAELKAELLAAGDSPLERLLIDRVTCCWLQTHALELAHVQSWAARDQKRRNAAERRLAKAAKALAEVRKLLGGV